MNFSWASRSDTGRVRDHNEDSVLPDAGTSDTAAHLIAVVADGMGGHAGGEVASRTAIETIAAVGGDPVIRIQAANVAVMDAARQRPRLAGMGTTVTMGVLAENGAARFGHVGDSRAYLLREGTLTQITDDHSFVGEMMAAGRLTAEQAELHPYRSVLTRAVGLESDVEVDAIDLDLEAGDRLLLCSDGLTSMVDDDAIQEILELAADPDEAADALVGAANAAGGADNITVVVIDVVTVVVVDAG